MEIERRHLENTDTNAPAVSAALPGESRPTPFRLDSDQLQRFLIGFLLAAAFFFVEAGVAEILLARNASCLESLARLRLAPDPNELCMSEFGFHLAGSVSRAMFDAEAPRLLVWPLLGVAYGLIGGALAQLSLRRAVVAYLMLHLLLLAGFTSFGYLAQFIV